MFEPYQWLVEHAEELGISESRIGPASVDLGITSVIIDRWMTPWYTLRTKKHGYFQTFTFEPGHFYLVSSVEYIKMPVTHCGLVNMRSSLARKGLGHKMAGFIDPGFEGQITLELETSVPVEVSLGERIAQLVFCRLSEATVKPYKGRYNGQRGPTEAYK